jgi:low temperature requirement protein LtrA
VWLAWVYTTWVTNFLDPDRLPVRLLLLALMLVGLLFAVGLPSAFAGRAALVAGSFCVIQIGRSAAVVALLGPLHGDRPAVAATNGATALGEDTPPSEQAPPRGDGTPDQPGGGAGTRSESPSDSPGRALTQNFKRILSWSLLSGAAWLGGVFVAGHARELVWAVAVGIDLLGGWVGFATPGLGRSRTREWTISGDHFAERCQAFMLIALGESIVDIGVTLSGFRKIGATAGASFGCAFVTSAALWWIYFDRSASEAAERIAHAADPGRLGRSAYHLIHPVMVAGIVVVAAADERVLAHPSVVGDQVTSWMVLGGPALFLLGHALFRRVIWARWSPWPFVAAALLGLVGALSPLLSALALAALSTAVVVAAAVIQRLAGGAEARSESGTEAGVEASGKRR